ncbi:hypothetical protein CRM22_007699 [Opisthorchis felineus]|uniref:MARVEL domain-containing protein n=1 Tax=Opisthorchis felineus TaxID=147828 RepID=A0A4S2LF80_OPIFE|nr:hypothetical protein CRM22_007699 [Opisthorchis felineus]
MTNMHPGLRGIPIATLSVSLALTLASLATDSWGCGNLFTDCQKTLVKSEAQGIAALLVLATLCLLLVLILDLVTLCNRATSVNQWVHIFYSAFLAIALMCLLLAVLIYTGRIGKQWAYFLAVCATVLTIMTTVLVVLRAISERI